MASSSAAADAHLARQAEPAHGVGELRDVDVLGLEADALAQVGHHLAQRNGVPGGAARPRLMDAVAVGVHEHLDVGVVEQVVAGLAVPAGLGLHDLPGLGVVRWIWVLVDPPSHRAIRPWVSLALRGIE